MNIFVFEDVLPWHTSPQKGGRGLPDLEMVRKSETESERPDGIQRWRAMGGKQIGDPGVKISVGPNGCKWSKCQQEFSACLDQDVDDGAFRYEGVKV